jgi:3-deoxy-D-manno-octulosonate 8-phosphate phosphatase (KDO 8-P phosphatase)
MINKMKHIKAFAFDCDGVMTDGTTQVTETGEAYRTFNIKDGFAVQHAIKQGYPIAIISGGNSKGIEHRFKALGVKDIYLAQAHKTEAFENFKKKYNLTNEEIAYMGDDMPDLPLLSICGLPCCPADAVSDIKHKSLFISSFLGGKGCAREILEKVLKLQEKWYTEELHHF